MTTTRTQKLLILLIVLTTIVLVWQLSLIFISQSTVSAATTPTASSKSLNNFSTVSANSTGDLKVLPKLLTDTHLTHELNKQISAANAGDTLPPQGLSMENANQTQYLEMVNEYQIAQMERLLAEENAAIAIAKRNAAQAAADTAKYINTRPDGATGDHFAGNDQDNGSYQVKYVDFQNHQWSAVLEQNGHYIQVNPGDVLPSGERVTDINNSGVVLRNGHEFRRVAFSGGGES